MMLGNQSIEQMEKRMGIEFPVELKDVLSKYHQDNVSIDMAEGFWHCFDLPFTMVCGGRDLTQLVYDYLSPMADKIIEPLQLSTAKVKSGYKKQEVRK